LASCTLIGHRSATASFKSPAASGIFRDGNCQVAKERFPSRLQKHYQVFQEASFQDTFLRQVKFK